MKKNKHSKKNLPNPSQSQRIRLFGFGLIVLLVLGVAGYLLFTALWPNLPTPTANIIDLTADMGGFNQKELRLKAGQPVTVRLTSLDNSHHTDGGGQHQWAVDELGVSIIAPPLGSNWATFTPDKLGVYTFYCDICCGGRANPTMQGKLIVEA
ncbi:MAG: cupredoxin domain-containing protein [Anaerolineae bacterium]|nr:cupredoxin domain-containing protein [Anaerolineae bacterium]